MSKKKTKYIKYTLPVPKMKSKLAKIIEQEKLLICEQMFSLMSDKHKLDKLFETSSIG